MKIKNLKFFVGMAVLGVFTSIFLLSCMGCGGVKKESLDDIERETTIITEAIDSIIKPTRPRGNDMEESLNRNLENKQIIVSDSTYAIIFYDVNGDSIGKYDIWENNPFSDLPFDVKDVSPGSKPLRYSVPDLPKEEFKRMFTQYPVEFMQASVSVGRVDIFANLPSYLEINKFNNYLPVTYQMNIMEGFSEEYDIPASYGIIKILDKTGKVVHTVNVPNIVGQNSVVTQDGNYLAFMNTLNKDSLCNCVGVFELNLKKIIFTKCIESHSKVGIGLGNENIIEIGFFDKLGKDDSLLFWLSSSHKKIFRNSFPPNFGNYKVHNIGLIKPMKGTPKDTLFFKDFNFTTLK